MTRDGALLLEANGSRWRRNTSGNDDGLWIIGSGECRVGRIGYVHRGGTGRNRGEAVVAARIGDGGANGAQHISQSDRDASKVWFARNL